MTVSTSVPISLHSSFLRGITTFSLNYALFVFTYHDRSYRKSVAECTCSSSFWQHTQFASLCAVASLRVFCSFVRQQTRNDAFPLSRFCLDSIHLGNVKILWWNIHCNIRSSTLAVPTKRIFFKRSVSCGWV